MNGEIFALIDYIKSNDGIGDKSALTKKVQEKFRLIRDRSVYYSQHYAIRFSYSQSASFSNTVISLSNLQKYDDLPFLVCLVTPIRNFIYLANTTFLHKVSHSSQALRVDNIRGSVNGSDIMKTFNNIANEPQNIEALFNIHAGLGFNENLSRLVEATNSIVPSGRRFDVSDDDFRRINEAPDRAIRFMQSSEFLELNSDLDERVRRVAREILIAGLIENINIRGRIIEYLIAGEDEYLRGKLIEALRQAKGEIPQFRTANDLADYTSVFDTYTVAIDVKTKSMMLNSNPKAYNIDKILEYLSSDKSVFMFYFVGIEPEKIINPVLIPMFQRDLLNSTIILKHWAGRNSRGVTQFQGSVLNKLILSPDHSVDRDESKKFLSGLITL